MLDAVRRTLRTLRGDLARRWRRWRARPGPSLAMAGRPDDFFLAGVQYYVLGRRAMLNGYPPVAGSLFHQGFEMILKACLMGPIYDRYSSRWRTGTPSERAAAIRRYTAACDKEIRRRLGHDLGKAWSRFKRQYPTAGLSPFDAVVTGLDEWWRIRYPNFPGGGAVAMTTSRVRTTTPTTVSPPADQYDLCLENMDELFAATVPLAYTAHAIRLAIAPTAAVSIDEDYRRENRHPVRL